MGYGEEKLFLKSFLPRLKNIKSTIPLFLWHKRRKEKAWQKEIAVLWALPKPASFWKSLTKTFKLWCSANISRSTVERRHYGKKIKPQVSKFLKDRGVGKGKLLSRSFLPPHQTQSNSIIPLFLWHERRKEKAWQKESAVLWGYSPQTLASFLKKTWLKTFKLWCSANIVRSTVERSYYGKKISPHVSKLLKNGGRGYHIWLLA